MKRTRLTAAVLALMLAAASAWAGDMTVEVSHDGFKPEKATIKAGDTITFENQVKMPGGHTVVADDGSFKSTPLATPGAKWSHTFTRAGAYVLSINEHAWVKGAVIVK